MKGRLTEDDMEQVYDIDLSIGEPTGEDLHGLSVLEDVGHPMVPKLDHSYYPREMRGNRTDVEVVARAIADPDYSVLLIGETGVGKDVLFKYVAQETNRPMVRINFGIGSTYEDLVGMFVPTSDGHFKWIDGVLTTAVREGWIFVADEVNAAPPEATMPLHGVTEEESARELTIEETNEVVKPHSEFKFAATMNPSKYAGTKELNRAFQNRFYSFEVPYLEKDAEVRLLLEKTNLGYLAEGEETAETLVDFSARVRHLQREEQSLDSPVSTRQLIQIANLIVDENGRTFMDAKSATKLVVEGFAGPGDWDALQMVIDKVF